MKNDELRRIVESAGGGANAQDYVDELLAKINRIESASRYGALLNQLSAAGNEGDLRGRLLEANFLFQFLAHGIKLVYGAKQGMPGDIDFRWDTAGHKIHIEMKLLGQDKTTRDDINAQLESTTCVTDDVRDVARIQFDLIQKSSTRKFSPGPAPLVINLVGIDVSELQLGTIDICDCRVAAGGNSVASRHCDNATLRNKVVGMFEVFEAGKLNADQQEWIDRVQKLPNGGPHPREYIHGALFLFREPTERAALSYKLKAIIVWNPTLVSTEVAKVIGNQFREVLPLAV